jgi:hypothetical protein
VKRKKSREGVGRQGLFTVFADVILFDGQKWTERRKGLAANELIGIMVDGEELN